MVFYGVAAIWIMVISYTEAVADSLFNLKVGGGESFLIFLTYSLAIVLGIILTGFLLFHFWLLATGKTTLEYCEKKKKANYDQGIGKNVKGVLGGNIFTWLLPIKPNYEGEGIEFKKKGFVEP